MNHTVKATEMMPYRTVPSMAAQPAPCRVDAPCPRACKPACAPHVGPSPPSVTAGTEPAVTERKSVLLRLDPAVHDALAK